MTQSLLAKPIAVRLCIIFRKISHYKRMDGLQTSGGNAGIKIINLLQESSAQLKAFHLPFTLEFSFPLARKVTISL